MTDRFCEDVKCKTHCFLIYLTGYFHLSQLFCPLPSVPAVLFLPSVSLVHSILLELKIMGVHCEAEKSAVTPIIESMMQSMWEKLRKKIAIFQLTV